MPKGGTNRAGGLDKQIPFLRLLADLPPHGKGLQKTKKVNRSGEGNKYVNEKEKGLSEKEQRFLGEPRAKPAKPLQTKELLFHIFRHS